MNTGMTAAVTARIKNERQSAQSTQASSMSGASSGQDRRRQVAGEVDLEGVDALGGQPRRARRSARPPARPGRAPPPAPAADAAGRRSRVADVRCAASSPSQDRAARAAKVAPRTQSMGTRRPSAPMADGIPVARSAPSRTAWTTRQTADAAADDHCRRQVAAGGSRPCVTSGGSRGPRGRCPLALSLCRSRSAGTAREPARCLSDRRRARSRRDRADGGRTTRARKTQYDHPW